MIFDISVNLVKESLEKGGYQGVFGFEKNKELVVNGLDGNL